MMFAVVGLSVAVSCSSESDESIEVEAATPGLQRSQLLTVPVPELCGHEPGRLVNGTMPLINPIDGYVSIAPSNIDRTSDELLTAVGDLTGDGVADGAIVTECTAGGVGWPATVQLYTEGPTLLGGVDLGDITGGREYVRSFRITDGVVRVQWMTNSETDFACCPSVPVQADLRWDGTDVLLENMVRG
ncbi:hypothetical protein CH267_06740 [Rhodococcus sp. 06-621-2]|nr:hypothetical protein CH267_06740 [Rhodococcus sp. 06-621-2]